MTARRAGFEPATDGLEVVALMAFLMAVTCPGLRIRVFCMIRPDPLLTAVRHWIGHVAGTPLTSPRRGVLVAVAASRRASFARPGRGRGVKQLHRLTPRDRAGCLRCATGCGVAKHPRAAGVQGRVAPAAGGSLRVVGP